MSREQGRSDEERRKRLAAALRDNLKRRKAQDRARRQTGEGSAEKAKGDATEPGSSD
jgi:hypothetical protein